MTAPAIAKALGCAEGPLTSVLRLVTGLGFFASPEPGLFALGERGHVLCRDQLGPLAAFVGSPEQWDPWARLRDAAKGGDVAFVAHRDHGLAGLRESGEEVQRTRGILAVEVAGGFVGDEQRRIVRERDRVHLEAVVLGHGRESREVAVGDRGARGREIRPLRLDPRTIVRRRIGRARHAAARADVLLARRGHCNRDLERPSVRFEQRLGEAIAAVRRSTRMHLHEAAEYRARRGSRSTPSQEPR